MPTSTPLPKTEKLLGESWEQDLLFRNAEQKVMARLQVQFRQLNIATAILL